MAIKVGEFLFAIGFGKPDTRNLVRAQNDATRAIRAAQKAVADGAEDAEEQIEAAAKAVAKHGRESKKEITGWGKAMGDLGREAKKAASDYVAAWRDPKKLTEAWGKALGQVKTGLVAAGAAAAAAAVGIGALVKNTAEHDLALVQQATQLGTGVRELSRLQQGAALAGVDVEAVGGAVFELQEKLGELASRGTGPALEALKDLNLTLADLEGKSAEDQFGVIADALERVDQTVGAKAVKELFGGEGGKLLPWLREGSAGMAELAGEAERLGLVVGEKAAKESAGFARDLAVLTSTVKALVADVVRDLMPVFRDWAEHVRQLVGENRALIRQKLAEFFAQIIPKLVELVSLFFKVASAGRDLAMSLGGMEPLLVAAGLAFGALKIAALGVPGLVIAASAALAAGIIQLGGYTDELERLQKVTNEARGRAARLSSATAAMKDLDARAAAGTLGEMSDEDFEEQVRVIESGSFIELDGTPVRGLARERLQARTRESLEAVRSNRTSQQELRAKYDAIEARYAKPTLESQLRDRLRARAARKGLRTGEAAINTAVREFQKAMREGSDSATAAKAAAAKLDSLGGLSGGTPKVDTRAADELFGADIRRMAKRDGGGAAAVKASLQAAAESLKGGATEGVARAAAYSALGQRTGREYKTGANGKDPLLSMILGKDVPDIEMGKLALGASPQVLQVTITNNIDVNAPITIPGAGSPSATGGAVADHIHGLFGSIAKAHKLAKVVFAR